MKIYVYSVTFYKRNEIQGFRMKIYLSQTLAHSSFSLQTTSHQTDFLISSTSYSILHKIREVAFQNTHPFSFYISQSLSRQVAVVRSVDQHETDRQEWGIGVPPVNFWKTLVSEEYCRSQICSQEH